MDDDTKIIKQQFEKLPEKLRQAVQSPTTQQELHAVGVKFQLSEGQRDALANETYLVLLGLDSLEGLVERVQQELEVRHEISKEIVDELHERIFGYVASSIQTFNQKQNAEENETERTSYQHHDSLIDTPRYIEERPTAKTAHQTAPGEQEEHLQQPPQSEREDGTHPAPHDENQPTRAQDDGPVRDDEEKKRPFNADPYREPIE